MDTFFKRVHNACILIVILSTSCSCAKIPVSGNIILQSWQSSKFSNDGCFNQSSKNWGSWDYFHSSNIPDKAGYHWLLIKLVIRVHVLSIAIFPRNVDTQHPELPKRAEDIEIYLNEEYPVGLQTENNSCEANFTHNLTSFSECGKTESTIQHSGHKVMCRNAELDQMTKFILLRKFARNEDNIYLNFIKLEIDYDRRFTITRHSISNAWQSSLYSPAGCFDKSVEQKHNSDNYFHSGESSDSFGYQWLLLNLTKSILISSLKIVARSVEPDRVCNIEVFVGDRLPVTGLQQETGHCIANFSHDLSRFLECGQTDCLMSNSNLEHNVRCKSVYYSQPTRYILIRRYVKNETDKYMNFRLLEIIESPESVSLLLKANLIRTWQSSSDKTKYLSSCFWQSNTKKYRAAYFHSGRGNEAADGGFHWFLMQLKQPVILNQIHLHIGGTNDEARISAIGIQVYYSNWLPADLLEKDSCQSSWIKDSKMENFIFCGETSASEIKTSDDFLAVSCSSPSSTASVILFRKSINSSNDAMKISAFTLFNAPKSTQFCIESRSGCIIGEMQTRKPNIPVMISAKLQCTLSTHVAPNCSISQLNRSLKLLGIIKSGTSSFTLEEFNMTLAMHGAKLQCTYKCNNAELQFATETFGLIVPAKSTTLLLNATQNWIAGRATTFTFITESAFPPPSHKCWLIGEKEQKTEINAVPNPLITVQSYPLLTLSTKFSLIVPQSNAFRIRCESHLTGTNTSAIQTQPIPVPLKASKTQFKLPQNISWTDGATLKVTIDSSVDNTITTWHTCFLYSEQGNSSVKVTPVTNAISTISLNVTRQWGTNATIECVVNQSGLIETWERQVLPAVLYPAKNISIRMPSGMIHATSVLTLLIHASEYGNPPAFFDCNIFGKRFESIKNAVFKNQSATLNFSVEISDNNERIRCHVLQNHPSGVTVFNQTVTSDPLNISYPANSSWTMTQPIEVNESETLTITLISIGGNPKPIHQCWLNSTSQSESIIYNNASFNGFRESETRLVTNFSVNFTRQMNGCFVLCKVTQGNQSDLTRTFSQSVNVFYCAQNITLTIPHRSIQGGSHALFYLNASDPGNPYAAISCTISGRLIGQPYYQLKKLPQSTFSTEWKFIPLGSDHNQSINCRIVQRHLHNAILYSQSIISSPIYVAYQANSSWTADNALKWKEGDLMTVSVTSNGGYPPPSHLCRIIVAKNPIIDLRGNEKQLLEKRQVVSIFSAISMRRMNGGSLECEVRQEGQPKLSRTFRQSIIVFFAANSIGWSGQLISSGTELQLILTTEDGNPRPLLDCSLKSDTVSIDQLTLIPESDQSGENSGWIVKFLLTQRFIEPQSSVSVSCLVSQFNSSSDRIFKPAKNSRTFQRALAPSASIGMVGINTTIILILLFIACLFTAIIAGTVALIRSRVSEVRHQAEESVEMPPMVCKKEWDPNTVYYNEDGRE